MGKPVIFETPGGEKMVVLPMAVYEDLVARAGESEDAADVAAFDAAMASLESGEDRRMTADEMAGFYERPGYLRGVRNGKP